MARKIVHRLAAGAVLAVLAFGSTVSAQPHGTPEQAPAAANLQGNDARSWIADPHMRRFYDTARAALAGGPAKIDLPAFEAASRKIFRAFAAARGADPDAMEDHLKLIPGQVVQIAREDPTILDSYDNFVAAIFGPQ